MDHLSEANSDSVRIDPVDLDRNDSEISTEILENFQCLLCEKNDPPIKTKCCSKHLCFSCYNKMLISGRTVSCPHCRSNPLLFESDDSSSEHNSSDNNTSDHGEEQDVDDINRPRAFFRLIIDFDSQEALISFMNSVARSRDVSFVPGDNLSQLMNSVLSRNNIDSDRTTSLEVFSREKILFIRTLYLVLQLILYYFIPNEYIFIFYLGYMFGTFNKNMLNVLLFYPVMYSFYIYKEYIKHSKIISSLNIIMS